MSRKHTRAAKRKKKYGHLDDGSENGSGIARPLVPPKSEPNVLALFDALLKRVWETGGVVEGYDDDVIVPLFEWWGRCGRAERAGVPEPLSRQFHEPESAWSVSIEEFERGLVKPKKGRKSGRK